jgi:hypothetical protein
VKPRAARPYRERRPVRALADVLATVWIQQVAADAAPYVHRTIPHGSVEVSVEIGSRLQVIGLQTGPTVGTLAPGAAMVGVRFHPGVAPAVLRVPACELVDRLVAGDELWGRRAVELGEAIAAAPSLEHATVIVEQAVFDLLADAARPDPIVVEAVRQLLPWARRMSAHSRRRCTCPSASSGAGSCPRSASRPRSYTGCCASRASLRWPTRVSRTTRIWRPWRRTRAMRISRI